MGPSQPLTLYGTGFNVWSQLSFDRKCEPEEDSQDLFSFHILIKDSPIGIPTSRLSYTLVEQGDNIRQAGSGYPHDDRMLQTAINGSENALGEVLIAVAPEGPGVSSRLCKLPTLSASPDDEGSQSWEVPGRVKQIAAWDTGWIVLYGDGTVATMGDARFEACLGREPTPESPADFPCRVPDLENLGEPIRRVAAGGYTVVALTESGSLYAWGTESPGMHRRRQGIPELGSVPNYIEVNGDTDIEDVAVGESHAIALATDGSAYTIGGNENGQLGLGRGVLERAHAWTKVDLGVEPGCRIVRVAGGPRSSFILVGRQHNDES